MTASTLFNVVKRQVLPALLPSLALSALLLAVAPVRAESVVGTVATGSS